MVGISPMDFELKYYTRVRFKEYTFIMVTVEFFCEVNYLGNITSSD